MCRCRPAWQLDSSDRARLGVRFNAGEPGGLINGNAPGKPLLLNDKQERHWRQPSSADRRLILMASSDGVWCDLAQRIWKEFHISVSEETLGGEARAMGYRKLFARPRHHAQDPAAAEASKKDFAAALAEIAVGPANGEVIKIWFQDETRIGKKNKITRRWASGNKAVCAARPANQISRHLPCNLPLTEQDCRPSHAVVPH